MAKKKTIAELEQEVSELNQQLDEAVEIISDQSQQLEQATTLAESPAENIFVIGKAKYEITAPSFIYEGRTYTAAEAVKNTALLEELLALNVGFITKKK